MKTSLQGRFLIVIGVVIIVLLGYSSAMLGRLTSELEMDRLVHAAEPDQALSLCNQVDPAFRYECSVAEIVMVRGYSNCIYVELWTIVQYPTAVAPDVPIKAVQVMFPRKVPVCSTSTNTTEPTFVPRHPSYTRL